MEKEIEVRVKEYRDRLIDMEKRDREIRDLRKAGWTLTRLAEFYGLTKQRVFQIVGKKHKRPQNNQN